MSSLAPGVYQYRFILELEQEGKKEKQGLGAYKKMKWIVTDVPTWVVGLVLIGGIPALAIVIKVWLGRRAALSGEAHNEVAGFLVAIVAAIYAVVVGFTIVSLYEGNVTAGQDVSTEAADLLQLHEGNFVLGPVVSARIDSDVVAYATAIVDSWARTSQGDESAQVQISLNDIYTTLDQIKPQTDAQADFLTQAVVDIDGLSQARVARQLEALEAGSLPLILWVGILLTSAVTLGFTVLFSLENKTIAYAMVIGVALVIAVNIFLLIELSYPFVGTIAVGPGKFSDVIQLIGR